ncbi:putative DNA repair protein Mus81 [Protomyces lactucae-debilis]|uniref:Crossover junction endonuclease MUS81 n=1 Tax=Protomyces lactucae-debilis TaxID=2754530 RepID=A0A1Y2FI93_PROLT|nr:putative DNA repair protein Mus81 [Protomyces lactucae-debilis]ORY83670.1 putative DNA repair protein Mus81 [Protomyces lactucae-debilis]
MPNELYCQWLKEWTERAREQESKGVHTLKRAYDSMRACPFEIGHPSQAISLKGLGPALCARLEKMLQQYCQQTGTEMPTKPGRAAPVAAASLAGASVPSPPSTDEESELDQRPGAAKRHKRTSGAEKATKAPKAPRAVKPYVPALRSGPYAILIALSDPNSGRSMTQAEIIRLAEPHCDGSFQVASDGKGYYTAWASMKTLVAKGFVEKQGRPQKYSLTDDGFAIAVRIRSSADPSLNLRLPDAERRLATATQAPASSAAGSTRQVVDAAAFDITQSFTPVIIPAGSFKVQLVIDNREVITQKDRDFIEASLYKSNIELIQRSLKVGDALWIAKCNDGREFVLDQIVERKRMDDLAASIKDGRWQEQRFRLAKCGAQQVIYIIEESHAANVELFAEAMTTAISTMQVADGHFVKRVPSLDGTINYLATMTKKLKSIYEGQTLKALPDHMVDSRAFVQLSEHLNKTQPGTRYFLSYDAFDGLNQKSSNMRVGDIWIRMLMCIRGVSAEKAVEIQEHFPTLSLLLQAYAKCSSQQEREKMMAEQCAGFGRKKIGNALSKNVGFNAACAQLIYRLPSILLESAPVASGI